MVDHMDVADLRAPWVHPNRWRNHCRAGREYKVSREVILRRLRDLDLLSQQND
jgi:hypothetical protein